MRLKTWRVFLAFHGLDHAAQVKPPRARKEVKHARRDDAHIEAFRASWPIGTQQRLAFAIMLYAGCRISDAVRLGPGMLQAGWICFSQQKTGVRVEIPLHAELPDFADHIAHSDLVACLDALMDRHMTWLVTAYGNARSDKGASSWLSDACRAAGLKDNRRCTDHGSHAPATSRIAARPPIRSSHGRGTSHCRKSREH
jgi:integrase